MLAHAHGTKQEFGACECHELGDVPLQPVDQGLLCVGDTTQGNVEPEGRITMGKSRPHPAPRRVADPREPASAEEGVHAAYVQGAGTHLRQDLVVLCLAGFKQVQCA